MEDDAGWLAGGVRMLSAAAVRLPGEPRDRAGTVREHDAVRVDLARAADRGTSDVPRLRRRHSLLRAVRPSVGLLRLHLRQNRQAGERWSPGAAKTGKGTITTGAHLDDM